jgi:predicted TIM-barrel fold metal-dependent hydrolase
MIIDIHTHLGDILHPNGGQLIFKKGIRKKLIIDLVTVSEWGLHRSVAGLQDFLYKHTTALATWAERARNATATIENMRHSMKEAGVKMTACMPIPPYVTFEDLEKACQSDDRIIPFTAVDFDRKYDFESELKDHVERGAKGLKLHPIIQKEPLTSKRTHEVVEAFRPFGLPVLFHCGVSSYYLGEDRKYNEVTEFGEIHFGRDLAAAFPDVKFIAGHAGLFQVDDVIEMLSGLKNVSVDISFQPPEKIRELVKAFGAERVLYASDWPYGNRIPAVKAVKVACKGDGALERLIFYENAATLLGMDV